MESLHGGEPVRSFAAARAGEVVLIRRILFGTLRALCSDLGLLEGSRVRCRAATPSHLLLETAGGRTIALERDRARFIQVSAQNPLPQNPLPQNPLHAAEPPENPGATALT